ncbi:glycine betaine ABC transporter substrate-binding protein [Texcoconibacillus texcoconensis]|uniref:Glycine betaine/proline transport system substrate-binding protein n=1 Tax=Texcoconibacillus texcoconensis TaxID=1095777 RepID=A0A840QLS5_9BACI|nr:glycine betaine ABC transporter substrate-binding protein [Texcoconibacillus texcoconensis]MBB5172322.1 glycine betaine/proline transport system substrate-binding protein [Texcoconibacillus texcoconensis]
MKKFTLSAFAVFSVGVGAACGGEAETTSGDSETNGGEEVSGTIEFGVAPWTSTVPPTEVAAVVLEDMGYETEQTEADVGAVYTGLSRGDLDVFMDAWFPMHNSYMDEYSDTIEETALSYTDASQGWTVPTYVEEIDSLEDIHGNEDLFNGEMYGIEEGAEVTEISRDLIDGEGFDMEQVVSSEGGMLSEVTRHIANEEPIVFYGWRPHSMFNNFDLKVLEDQAEYFEIADVKVVSNKDFAEEKPEAYEFLSNWYMPLEDVEAMIVEIENEDRDPREVAEEWVDENEGIVNEWLGQ